MPRDELIVRMMIGLFQGVLSGAVEEGVSLEEVEGFAHNPLLPERALELVEKHAG